MNPSAVRATTAQITNALMWIADFTGHANVGTIFHDPRTGAAIAAFVIAGTQVWSLGETLYLAFAHKKAVATVAALTGANPKE